MNTEIITKPCWEWSKETWQQAYTEYCKHNMFGAKTKKQYYDMVVANYKRLEMNAQPLSEKLTRNWLAGWRNAVQWAKKRKCGRNGELLTDRKEDINLEELKDDVRELQWDMIRIGGRNE